MKRIIEFLTLLEANNNREWFNDNKNLYLEAKEVFTGYMEGLIEGISRFDDSVCGLKAKDCIYRIHRDTRFSNDKTPYKTHFGGFIVARGKQSGLAGYYVHIEPTENGMLGCSMLASGLIMPQPAELRSIREEILDYGDEIMDIVDKSDGFKFSLGNSLKRTPAGFPRDTKVDFLLRLRDHFIDKRLSNRDILGKNFLQKSIEAFRTTKPYIDHLNRAVLYARDEMR